MEVLPLDAPYGLDHVRLCCCCTKRNRICGICDRCEISLSFNWRPVGERADGDIGIEMLDWASLCLYMDFYRANGSFGARGETISSPNGRLGGVVEHVKALEGYRTRIERRCRNDPCAMCRLVVLRIRCKIGLL